MIIYLSLLVAFVGGMVYLLCNGPGPTNPKVAELGRLMFGCGLLAFLFMVASGHTLTVIK